MDNFNPDLLFWISEGTLHWMKEPNGATVFETGGPVAARSEGMKGIDG